MPVAYATLATCCVHHSALALWHDCNQVCTATQTCTPTTPSTYNNTSKKDATTTTCCGGSNTATSGDLQQALCAAIIDSRLLNGSQSSQVDVQMCVTQAHNHPDHKLLCVLLLPPEPPPQASSLSPSSGCCTTQLDQLNITRGQLTALGHVLQTSHTGGKLAGHIWRSRLLRLLLCGPRSKGSTVSSCLPARSRRSCCCSRWRLVCGC